MSTNRRFFNLTAWGYDFITRQDVWRTQIEATLSFIDRPERIEHIIDLGCGPGISSFVLAERLPDASILGVDISDQMIHRARRHHQRHYSHLNNLEFTRCDVYDLPFETASFDLAIGHSFLYLLPDRGGALAAIRRILANGGRLVLMEPNAQGSLREALQTMPRTPLVRAPISTTRFATSMLLWQLVSRTRGRISPDKLRELFEQASMEDVIVRPTLHGLGLHATGCRGVSCPDER